MAASATDSDVVIREVTQGVWTFSKPFARYGWFPIGGRSTAVQLASGDVWILASTPLTPETKSTIDKLGPVKYLVAPDAGHHLYLGEFHKAYPGAKLIGVEPLVAKKEGEMKFDGVYGKDAPEAKYGFEPEIEACYFSGFKNKDVAFFHAPSKTLIQADLLFNLPPTEQYSKSKSSATIPILSSLVTLDPFAGFHKTALNSLGIDRDAMIKDAKKVSSWDFTRIIPCHGDVIEGNGKAAWNEAYKNFLN